jgi:tetrahydromethanopterin S-methyltransferase subunit H
MYNFTKPQKKFKIGNIEIGGLPGERPIVLIGSIFYLGHKITESPLNQFSFDKKKAEELLNLQDTFSDKTGNPCMVDLIISQTEAVEVLINFVSEMTDAVILLDPVGFEVKNKALNYVNEIGLKDRIIFNSITLESPERELEALRESGIESSILLAFSSKAFTTLSRIEAIRKLVSKTSNFIKKPLIDTYVLDIPSLGMACKAMHLLKQELGLPVGAGTENAVSTWKGLKNKMGIQAKKPSIASAAITAVLHGADFILYGPIENSEYIFPSVALVDASIEQLSLENGLKANIKLPLFKIG